MTSPPPKKQRVSTSSPHYKLEPTTGDPIPITPEAIRHIKALSTMLDLTVDSASDAPPLPAGEVSQETLEKIVEWCEHHKDEEIMSEEELEDVHDVPEWDSQFLEGFTAEEMTKLVIAADYLDVGLLSVFASEKIARSVDGKSCEEIMKKWGIPEN